MSALLGSREKVGQSRTDLANPGGRLNSTLDWVPRGCRLPDLVPSWLHWLAALCRSLQTRKRKSLIFLTLAAIS